jgi:hypothetical protein
MALHPQKWRDVSFEGDLPAETENVVHGFADKRV